MRTHNRHIGTQTLFSVLSWSKKNVYSMEDGDTYYVTQQELTSLRTTGWRIELSLEFGVWSFGVRQSVGGRNHGFLGPGGFDQKSPKTKASQNEIPTLPSDPITSVTSVPPSLSLSHSHTHTQRNRTKTQSHTLLSPKKLPVVFSQNSLFFHFALL